MQIYLIALKRSLKKCDREYKDLFILGDLNWDWNKSPLDSHTHRLKSLCTLYQLRQIINEPTRVTKSSATQIDLILLNNPESISNFGVIELGISDHSLIYVVKKLVPSKGQRKCSEIRNFKNFIMKGCFWQFCLRSLGNILNNSIILMIVGRSGNLSLWKFLTDTHQS